MKFTFFVLALAVFCFSSSLAQSQPGGYQSTPIDLENQEQLAILNFGLQEAVQDAIGDGKLAEGNWTIEATNSLETQVVEGTNYEWSIDITNGEGQIVPLDFIVYVALDNTMSLVSYNILLTQQQ